MINQEMKYITQYMMASGLFHDEHQALDIFRGSLLALRDRLPKVEALYLAKWLPESLRESYLEGWENNQRQAESVNKSEFLAEAAFHLKDYSDHSLGELVPAALKTLLKMISETEAEQVRNSLPRSMQDIFNDQQSM